MSRNRQRLVHASLSNPTNIHEIHVRILSCSSHSSMCIQETKGFRQQKHDLKLKTNRGVHFNELLYTAKTK